MAQNSTTNTSTPFWTSNPTEASGRDPLAIQNSSVVIYTNMVVGITNVTNRVRYVGFYCWLFEAITHKVAKTNSLKEQQLYLRRAELLLAYLYVYIEEFKGVTGISGTNFALTHTADKLRLDKGADKVKGATSLYWKFGMGVFGQYYSGAMRDLGLITHPLEEIQIYVPTDKGIQLAQAYNHNIPAQAKELFIKSIFSGSIEAEQMQELAAFALHSIPAKSEEQQLYKDILLSADYPPYNESFHRRVTIYMLLNLLKNKPEGIEVLMGEFLRVNYEKHNEITDLEDNTATAWYVYELNELLHVSFEHFHAAFQYSIAISPTSMPYTISQLVEAALEKFGVGNTKSIGDLIEIEDISKTYRYFLDMLASYRKDWGTCLSNAIHTIMSVYKQCQSQKEAIYKISTHPDNNYARPGYALEMMHDLVDSKLQLTVEEYCKQILLLAINQHMFSSYQKSRIGQGLVHNYIIEDNMAWRLRDTSPGRTSPRLQNMIQYLCDIGLIVKENDRYLITEAGLKVIA
jgi:hypothetical protein